MGPYLIWTITLERELAVEGMKDVVGGAGAVGFHVVRVQVVVVDEGAIENHAAVGLERTSEQVGGVCGAAAIAGRAGLALRIGLHRKAGEIRNDLVDLIYLRAPPCFYVGIERIEGLEAADFLRTGDVDADGKAHAPRTHRIGNASQAFDHAGLQGRGGVIHVVHVAAIDADGGEQACVLAHCGQVVENLAILEEKRTASVAAGDAAIEIVPLVDPTDGHGGGFVDDCLCIPARSCEPAHERKRAVQHTSLAAGGDHYKPLSCRVRLGNPKPFGGNGGG